MVKKVWLPLLTTIVFGGIWFYFAIPAINPKHASFWSFLIALVVVFIISRLVFTFSLKGIVKKVQKGTTTSADGTVTVSYTHLANGQRLHVSVQQIKNISKSAIYIIINIPRHSRGVLSTKNG